MKLKLISRAFQDGFVCPNPISFGPQNVDANSELKLNPNWIRISVRPFELKKDVTGVSVIQLR
jgi:hypothetical protein